MPRPPRLLVIDPSVAWPEDEGVRVAVGDWPGEVVLLRPALSRGDGPGPGDGHDAEGVLLLGSRASVHDDRPWLRALGEWLDPVLRGDRPLPLLGICFGHQLIARRAGSPVGYVHADRRQELGVRETEIEESRLTPGAGRMRVVASHRERVERVPPRFRVFARREGVPVDAMEHDSLPIFSVQFHPEARAGFLTRRGADAGALDAGAAEANDRLLAEFRRLALAARPAPTRVSAGGGPRPGRLPGPGRSS